MLIVTTASMAIGRFYPWPDYYHTDYGLPLTWGTHVENSILGPVDKWVLNYGSLSIDLVFWGAVSAAAMLIARFLAVRGTRASGTTSSP